MIECIWKKKFTGLFLLTWGLRRKLEGFKNWPDDMNRLKKKFSTFSLVSMHAWRRQDKCFRLFGRCTYAHILHVAPFKEFTVFKCRFLTYSVTWIFLLPDTQNICGPSRRQHFPAVTKDLVTLFDALIFYSFFPLNIKFDCESSFSSICGWWFYNSSNSQTERNFCILKSN